LSRAIYHALYPRSPCYERQWLQSVRSLRRHNPEIPVYLAHYGEPSEVVRAEVKRQDIILLQSDYDALLAGMAPHIASVLRGYPVIHKFAALHDIDADSVLYVDCDTWFYRDPAGLFDLYSDAEFYAHVEPCTARDIPPDCGDPRVGVDAYMHSLASARGFQYFPPYNTGVCLFNHDSGWDFSDSLDSYFHYLYRFMCDIHEKDPSWEWAREASGPGLPYPPMYDFWLVEQVALWHIWGAIGLSHDIIRREDVALSTTDLMDQLPFLIHYFHTAEDQFFQDFATRIL
jgi:hypothetical protein